MAVRNTGSAARQKDIGKVNHLRAGLIVTAVILWISLRTLLHYAETRELRLAAIIALAILVRSKAPAFAREFASTRVTAASQGG